MNAEQFCAEYGHELKSGKISFSKKVVDKFISTYTYLSPEDFSNEMRERLKTFVMIDLCVKGYSKMNPDTKDMLAEKIELPQSIF